MGVFDRVVVWAGYDAAPRLASTLRRAWARVANPQATVRFDGPVRIGSGFKLNMPQGGTFEVAKGASIGRRFRADLGGEARISIGPGTKVGDGVLITCDTSIDIGADCVIDNGAYIVDGNHRFRDPDVPILDQGYNYRPLAIGNRVRVGHKCTVISNIADGAVVGPNSIVTKPVAEGAFVIGVPAKEAERAVAQPEGDSKNS